MPKPTEAEIEDFFGVIRGIIDRMDSKSQIVVHSDAENISQEFDERIDSPIAYRDTELVEHVGIEFLNLPLEKS